MPATERFNSDLADKAVGFIEKYLVHTEGESIGKPVRPMEWQRDIFCKVIGSQVIDDDTGEWVRRYTDIYVEVPRKNGKSFWMSAAAIYHLMADPTIRGLDILCVACDTDQADVVFNTAAEMIENNPQLEKRCYIAKRSKKRIENLRNGNRLFVIPGDADGALGTRPAVIIFDELLAQKKRALYDALTTGQGHAKQPLLYMITTAGEYGTICHEVHEYGTKVASGEIEDKSFLFVRYGISEGDDWRDEKVWKKANPGLGVSPKMRFLRGKFKKAEHSLEAQLVFRKFYLNEWNLSETAWLDMPSWEACGKAQVDPESVRGCRAWIGVDLSSRKDLTAVVGLFERDEDLVVIPRFFQPEDGIDDKSRRDGVPYRGWAEAGLLTLTPGRTIDYGAVFEAAVELADLSGNAEIGYDQANAGDFEAQLEKAGYTAFDVQQGFWLSESLKALEAAMLDGRLVHGGHPVLKWNAANAIVKFTDGERIKLAKKLDNKRIDGIAALANAFDRKRRHEEEPPSVYEERGIRSI